MSDSFLKMGDKLPLNRGIYGMIVVVTVFLGFFACEFEEPIPTYTLTITLSPNEGGKITRSPELPNYKAGEVVTLSPEPNEHWVFKQWDGDATGNTTPLQISMNSNKSVTGVFVKRDYPLNIKIEGQGTVEEKIIPNPSGREYPHGTRVELKPIPKEGWVFESWGGDLSGNETPQIITVDKEKNVIAKFKRRDYPLNINITGEGTVEEKIVSVPGGKTYPFETIVELKPVPKLGWVFESWGGDLTGNEATKNIAVDKEKNVTVKFKRKDYLLNVTISGEGTVEEKIVSSPGGRSYPYQTVVELAPKPKDGWVFESWAGDLTGSETPKNITVDKEKNVTAKFKRRDYPLTLILEGEGLVEEKIVSSPGDRTYPFQTVVELTPKPKDGWVFESWGGDLTGIEVPKTITVDKEKNVTVKFKRKDYSLNITITGEGTVEEKIVSNPGGRTYPFLTVVELTPRPKEGWEFESWGGDLTGNEAPKNITVDKEKNVTAKFVIIDPLKDFSGYPVNSSAKILGTDYWENSILPSDLIVAVFQKNYENIHPSGAYAVWTEAICNGDFNNDGYMDVFNAGTTFGGQIKATLTFLIWNPTTKIFEEKNLINDKTNNVGHPRLVTPVYLNSDNYVDIVIHGMRDEASNSNPNEPVSICLSDGKGGYDITKLDLEPKSLANQFGHEWGDVEDVTGDGLPDLFVSANSHSYIFWGINTFPYFTNINFAHFSSDTKNYPSDNGFGEEVPSGAGAVYGGVFLDVNKDGQKDLLLAVGENGIQPNGNKDQQRVLLNKGNGRFNETGVIKLPLYSNQINSGINQFDYKVDDLNGDGRLDIIAINSVKYSQWNIVIYLQQSDGSFVIDTSLVEYNLNTISRPQYKTRLVYSDLNGDGLKDISYINSSITPYYSLQNNELLTKSVFIRVGNKFVEKDYYQFDPYAKSLKDKYYK